MKIPTVYNYVQSTGLLLYVMVVNMHFCSKVGWDQICVRVRGGPRI